MSRSNTLRAGKDRIGHFKRGVDFTKPQYRACERKTAYVSERIANKECARIQSVSIDNNYLRTYKCTFCKQFHLTSSPKK